MKDIKGKEIKVGYRVLYFAVFAGKTRAEEAKVIEVREKSIKVEFLGDGHEYSSRKKGQQTFIYNTSGKIFIIEEIRYLTDKIKYLEKENKQLQAEVDKIHDRFEILDIN